MIQSFRSKSLKRLFEDGVSRGIQPNVVPRIEIILDALDQAASIEQIDGAVVGLHPLRNDRAGEWSITVTRNWRIVFTPVIEGEEFHVYDVEYTDYH